MVAASEDKRPTPLDSPIFRIKIVGNETVGNQKMQKAGGNWVVGEKFFNREAELEALAERVQEGTHTLLTAQRRMGKTSLVRELLRRLEDGG